MYFNFPSSISAKFLPQTPRKNPLSKRKNPLSEVKFSTSNVKQPFFWPFFSKKKERTPVFKALSSFLGQRYNIFRRNPNRFNTSQHSSNANLQRFAADGGWDGVYYEARGSNVNVPHVACNVWVGSLYSLKGNVPHLACKVWVRSLFSLKNNSFYIT